jgi:hypothetical protein
MADDNKLINAAQETYNINLLDAKDCQIFLDYLSTMIDFFNIHDKEESKLATIHRHHEIDAFMHVDMSMIIKFIGMHWALNQE